MICEKILRFRNLLTIRFSNKKFAHSAETHKICLYKRTLKVVRFLNKKREQNRCSL